MWITKCFISDWLLMSFILLLNHISPLSPEMNLEIQTNFSVTESPQEVSPFVFPAIMSSSRLLVGFCGVIEWSGI